MYAVGVHPLDEGQRAARHARRECKPSDGLQEVLLAVAHVGAGSGLPQPELIDDDARGIQVLILQMGGVVDRQVAVSTGSCVSQGRPRARRQPLVEAQQRAPGVAANDVHGRARSAEDADQLPVLVGAQSVVEHRVRPLVGMYVSGQIQVDPKFEQQRLQHLAQFRGLPAASWLLHRAIEWPVPRHEQPRPCLPLRRGRAPSELLA
mmetsp:Transcript_176623/g.566325  ORF Transcript_176623/g.566325 Transcript_176623/m.566325 type:complete len:206 (-) Transcript_176623:362-979(-)